MNAATHATLIFRQPSARPQRAVGGAPGLGRRIGRTVALWRRRLEDRAALRQLSYRDMRDIGVTPTDIARELAQPFWRAAPPR